MEVTINIRKEIIRDFLGYLFERNEEGVYIVNRNEDTGKLICALSSYCEYPVQHEGNCTLRLPLCDATEDGRRHFMYIGAEAEARINNYLEVVFNLDYDRYWIQGIKLGLSHQDIVYGYMLSRKLVSMDITGLDTLKKRLYRHTTRRMAEMHKRLTNRACYIDRKIRETIKDQNNVSIDFKKTILKSDQK